MSLSQYLRQSNWSCTISVPVGFFFFRTTMTMYTCPARTVLLPVFKLIRLWTICVNIDNSIGSEVLISEVMEIWQNSKTLSGHIFSWGAGIAQSVYRQATGWMVRVRFAAQEQDFSLLHSFQTGAGTHPVSYPFAKGAVISVGGKAAREWSWLLTSI
jgi:hypothetical protein